MSNMPSLVVGSPDTPGTIDIPIESSNNSSTATRLVISVVGEKFVPNDCSISKTITKNFKKRKMLLDTHGGVLLSLFVNSIGMNS
ncbi:hypothetical protein P3L10_006023 [Capsicum annuum]